MSRYGSLNDVWPYAAAVTGGIALLYIALYRFGGSSARRGAGWKYTSEIDHIRKLMREERYDEAAAFVQPLLQKNDITPEFFDVAAVIADKRGRAAEAGKYWRDMMRYYPSEPWGYMRTARFLLRQGKTAQAHRVLDRARKIVKHPSMLNNVLAQAAQASEQWDEAIQLWAELRATAPGEVNAYLQARTCLLAVGRRDEADALLADVAARMPSNPEVKKALAAAKKASAAG
jgi:predicted Zn-dependent protease